MKAANEDLGAGHNIENVEEEDETYVELVKLIASFVDLI
jgi:hypothetical protein